MLYQTCGVELGKIKSAVLSGLVQMRLFARIAKLAS